MAGLYFGLLMIIALVGYAVSTWFSTKNDRKK